jgi:hypothetical protein
VTAMNVINTDWITTDADCVVSANYWPWIITPE